MYIEKAKMLFVLLIFALPISAQAEVYDHRKASSQVNDHRKASSQVNDHRKDRSHSLQDSIKQVTPFKEWMIGANKKGVVDAVINSKASQSSFYNLKGLKKKKFLQYERQGTGRGINIGWTNNASASTAQNKSRWMFVPQNIMKRVGQKDKDSSIRRFNPIRYGEKIAIAWVPKQGNSQKWNKDGKGKFLKYSHRNIGINLDWSSKPFYEWTILGGKPGTTVRRGVDKVIIYNLVNKQPLVYYPRGLGGKIGWPNSKGGDFGGAVVLRRKMPPQNVWLNLIMKGTHRGAKG